ncbi:MAG: hypothetical protein K2Q10_02635, partial [Rhodospirillales bacterium]|nr:hypothetical protein [Rhodospirillales bacterium]
YNKEFFDEAMRKILEKYIRETISDHQLARFLLNDIIRYYRTTCVDFEQKTAEARKPWGTRNIKLVFPRKLIYFSGVLAVAETYRCTAKEKVEKLLALLALSPVERIIDICGSKALPALALYDFFLEEFSKETVRDECDSTTETNRHDQPTFRLLKNSGHEFSEKLRSLLNGTYDPGHPIHHALLF